MPVWPAVRKSGFAPLFLAGEGQTDWFIVIIHIYFSIGRGHQRPYLTTRVAFRGGSWSPEACFDHEVTYWGCPGQAKADLGPIQPNPGQPGLGQRSKPEPGPGGGQSQGNQSRGRQSPDGQSPAVRAGSRRDSGGRGCRSRLRPRRRGARPGGREATGCPRGSGRCGYLPRTTARSCSGRGRCSRAHPL